MRRYFATPVFGTPSGSGGAPIGPPRAFIAGLLGVVLLLAGCATKSPEASEALAVSIALGEALGAQRLPEDGQRSAVARAQGAFDAEPGDVNRVRLATLLAELPKPMRDEVRARELLEPLAGERSATPAGRLAALLVAQLAERRKFVELAAEQERAADRREEAGRRQIDLL
ncbi:MAG: hypothetical protein OEW21_17810, partial [Betaproteobacteria bacterium]|nr:hypothetical protein [Betaproteobacteria bacterium]